MNDELKEFGRRLQWLYEYQSTKPTFACRTVKNYEKFKVGRPVFRPRLEENISRT
jgi:hypothetical protein